MTALTHRLDRPGGQLATAAPAEPAARDLTAILRADHERLGRELAAIRGLGAIDPKDPQHRQTLCYRLLASLSQHLVATSCCVAPAARGLGGPARDLARQQSANSIRLHQIMRCAHQLLGGDMLAGPYSFTLVLDSLADALAEHVRIEEDRLLPALGAGLGADRMTELGQLLCRRLNCGPTRAHPNLSFQSRWAPAAARLAAAWDRVLDVLDSRPLGADSVPAELAEPAAPVV